MKTTSGLDFKLHEMAQRIRDLREIVGLTPGKAMIDCAEFYLKACDFDCHNQIMEYHLLDMK